MEPSFSCLATRNLLLALRVEEWLARPGFCGDDLLYEARSLVADTHGLTVYPVDPFPELTNPGPCVDILHR